MIDAVVLVPALNSGKLRIAALTFVGDLFFTGAGFVLHMGAAVVEVILVAVPGLEGPVTRRAVGHLKLDTCKARLDRQKYYYGITIDCCHETTCE